MAIPAWAATVLNDAKFALERFHRSSDDQERRVLWFALIGLLRATGHVLDKVDAPADPQLRVRVDAWWPTAKQKPIIKDFIERDRNAFLKTYRPMPAPKAFTTLSGTPLTTTAGTPLTTTQLFIAEGPFKDRAAADVASEAIQWWESQLAALA